LCVIRPILGSASYSVFGNTLRCKKSRWDVKNHQFWDVEVITIRWNLALYKIEQRKNLIQVSTLCDIFNLGRVYILQEFFVNYANCINKQSPIEIAFLCFGVRFGFYLTLLLLLSKILTQQFLGFRIFITRSQFFELKFIYSYGLSYYPFHGIRADVG